MINPYVVGPPVHQERFYGRQDLVEDLLDERHQCVYLVGNRRIGKTSLLHYLEGQASHVALFLNLQATGGDPIRMGKELAKEVKRKARKTPVLKNVHLEIMDDICDVTDSLTEAAEDGGFNVLLLWDEAEKLLLLSDDCLERLRSALQDKKVLRTILTATKGLSELNDRCRSWETSPFLFGFAIRNIPLLCDQEASNLICQVNNPGGPVQVDMDLQAQITDLAGCHPYLIQLLCDRLFEPEGRLRPITKRDLVVDATLANLFQIDYSTLSHSERAILRKLSKQDAVDEEELNRTLKIQPDDLRSYLHSLEHLGYVRYRGGYYQVANHFLHTWLKRECAMETPEVVSDQASLEMAKQVPDRASSGRSGQKVQNNPSIQVGDSQSGDNPSKEGKNVAAQESTFSHGYALLVGVGRYKDSSLSVPTTAHDAEDLGKILINSQLCAYPGSQVQVLTNEAASKARILAELDELEKKTKGDSNATVVIFFSGHGWQQNGYYFLPHETETFHKGGKLQVEVDTALANEDFLDKVRQIAAQRLVILFNTCFAGGVGTALSPEVEALPQLIPVPLGLYDQLIEGSGRVIISSSQANEKSWIKGTGARNSIFVDRLLSALRGEGIKISGNAIRILDLFKHLNEVVPADAKTIGREQTPVLHAYSVTQNFPVALLLGGKGLSPDISDYSIEASRPLDAQSLQSKGSLSREYVLERMKKKFDLEGVQTLCFTLGIDYDELSASNKTGMIRELYRTMVREDRLGELIGVLQRKKVI